MQKHLENKKKEMKERIMIALAVDDDGDNKHGKVQGPNSITKTPAYGSLADNNLISF